MSPVIILLKLILQKLWRLGLGWDESVPLDIHTQFVNIYTNLAELEKISIPRLIILYKYKFLCLIGFCDASEDAMGARLYARSEDEQENVECNLSCAKSRAAPLKSCSILLLELCAAVLLVKMNNYILKFSRTIEFQKIFL